MIYVLWHAGLPLYMCFNSLSQYVLSYDVSHIIVLDAPYEGLVHLQAESFLPGVVQQFSRRRFSLETLRTSGSLAHDNIIYCRVPEGRGLHQSARPLSRDETRSENP